MAFPHPVSAGLVWLADYLTSRGRNPDMVNEWTRDDLPAVMDLVKASAAAMATDPSGGAYAALDAVVDHLNRAHPKPSVNRVLVAGQSPAWVFRALEDDHQQALVKVERERDDLRRQVEDLHKRRRKHADERAAWTCNRRELISERDAAVARADQLRDERDDAVQSCLVVGRERDEWKARAEVAEQERDEWESLYLKATFRGAIPIARAEAVEARTAPAVSREDVEKAVRRGHNMFNAEVGVVNEMCDLFGVEAGQAVDPVKELAEQIKTATQSAIESTVDLIKTSLGVTLDAADLLPEDWERYASDLAAHVLGQEVK